MKSTDYKAIYHWHKDSGSYGYYIHAQQEKALKQGQPTDVLFEHFEKPGTWCRLGDLKPDHPFLVNHPELKEQS